MEKYGRDCYVCPKQILCGINGTADLYIKSFKYDRFWAIKKMSSGLCVNILKHEKIIDQAYIGGGTSFLHICAHWYKDTLKHPYVGAICNDSGWTPLHICADLYEEAQSHPLFTKSITIDKGVTPLHMAAKKFLSALNHPLARSIKDFKGYTPMHYYAFNTNDEEGLRILLNMPTSEKSISGKTAQQVAYAKLKKLKGGERNEKDPF